jgi:hypothetical protein
MRFKIYASEIVYYTVDVDADDEDDALNQADNNACDFKIVNNSGYQVDRIEALGE